MIALALAHLGENAKVQDCLMPNTVTEAGDQIRSWLQQSDFRLHAGQYTYSIPTSTSVWPGYGSGSEPFTGYAPPNDALATGFRAALAIWDSYIAPNFVEVADDASTRGEVRVAFTTLGSSSGEYAHAYSGNTSVPGGRSGDVWIQAAKASDPFTAGTYSFQAVLHELGHALGLKHSFDAPAVPAAYESTRYTIMSYTQVPEQVITFSGTANSIQSTAASPKTQTPMVLDIAAVQAIYGADPTTRADNSVYQFTQGDPSLQTIYDAGGIDTIDLSNFTRSNVVDLTPGSYSSIGIWSTGEQIAYWQSLFPNFSNFIINQFAGESVYTWTNNLGIAQTTVIERATGGSAADTLIGNDADNVLIGNGGNDTLYGGNGNDILIGGAGSDTMSGGPGSDIFSGTRAELNGDTITDFASGDRITIIDAAIAGFTFALTGQTLSFAGATLTLAGLAAGTRLTAVAANSGVDLVSSLRPALHDFNGDGRSDILWRSDAGQLSNWLANPNGGFGANDGNALTSVASNWRVVGTGDFNGDGRSDILWRSDSGQLSDWLANSAGGFASNDANVLTTVATSWKIAGTGDFNGDGRADILWRNDNGQMSDWLGNANGGFGANDANAFASVPTSWRIAGTGDFNGDGRTDILWRNDNGQLSDWLANDRGGFAANDSEALSTAPISWHVVGTGDFNGDGRADILWRNDSGMLSDWLANANGGFFANDANALINAPINWHVVDTGDYNGDGRDDILWRSDSGQLSDWLAAANGGFTANDVNALASVATNWHTQGFGLLI